MKTKVRLLWGIMVSFLLIAPITAIFYVAYKAVELPFVPTNVMDWMIRQFSGDLGGDIITFGIDTMVDLITTFNLGRTDTTAKMAEQMTGIMLFIGIGVAVGTIYYYFGNMAKEKSERPIWGLMTGLLIAVPIALISDHTLTANNAFYSGPSFAARTAWILALLGVWGVGINLVFNKLTTLPNTEEALPAKSDMTPVAETAPPTQQPSTALNRTAVERMSRRQFLIRLGGATATMTVLGAGLGRLFEDDETVTALSQSDFSFDEFPNMSSAIEPAPGTRPEYTPLDEHYRIDINSGGPPEIDGDAWFVQFKGMFENPIQLTLNDLQNNYEPMNQYVTLSCISNRIAGRLTSTTGWTGVSMQTLLREARPADGATHLKISSADGFFEYVDLDVIENDERVMLTYAWDQELLRVKHGFPARIYIPDRYGMKQPKWITEIEAVAEWGEGYWVERGWSREAIMRATSVIDTVAVDNVIEDGDNRLIPIGGIAHAGARSISKVEVQVDDGEWVEAQLRQPLSDTTWVIWRYDWVFEEGDHTFAVRCIDGNGEMQILEDNDRRPNGATGIHTQSVTV
jgi:DMSO/TMAO reductase YedYZ molybdopterin-dependent catalytic subunit